eukprot:2041214-Rhodomonas_salina.1
MAEDTLCAKDDEDNFCMLTMPTFEDEENPTQAEIDVSARHDAPVRVLRLLLWTCWAWWEARLNPQHPFVSGSRCALRRARCPGSRQ